ncbi:MAG: protein kinase domain-containing protein [bacterium]
MDGTLSDSDDIRDTRSVHGGAENDDTASADFLARTGNEIGPYRLLDRVGSGGMGEVWRAEQTKPVKRIVALKLIKAGMDSRDVIARFEGERQALALMDHPCIARVFEAGTTPEGRPYFAMEYVAGRPITDFCDQRKLNTRERLALFQQCCEGVQHAHQKAVLHRDLKPSNILVTDLDGKPTPKIIDFGVAKATTQALTDRSMHTAVGQMIGTVEYMSPEQADPTGNDVDTRTDVYSLGVILYELLAGALPFDSKELRRASVEGVRDLLQNRDPLKPSARLSSLGAETKIIAAQRRTDPRRLNTELKGDLDWIVLRAMEKDRSRRYGSPRELAQDIQRHVENQPVLAGPPSARYRAAKFVRRHRAGVLVACATVAVVVAFAVNAALSAERIRRERDRAEESAAKAQAINAFLQEMLHSADPWAGGERDFTVAQALDAAAKNLDTAFPGQPLLEADMRAVIGSTYLALGKLQPGAEQTRRALALRIDALGPDAPEVADLWVGMVEVHKTNLDHDEAIKAAREVVRIRRLGSARPDSSDADALITLALRLTTARRHAEGDSVLTVAEQTLQDLGGDTRYHQAMVLALRAQLADEQSSDLVATDSLIAESIRLHRAVDPDAPLVGVGLNNRAVAQMQLGNLAGARSLFEETLVFHSRVLGENHPSYALALENLANVDLQEKKYDDALVALQRVREIRARNLGEDHIQVARTTQNMAVVASRSGQAERSLELFESVLPLFRSKLGENNTETAACERNMSVTLLTLGRYSECDQLLRQSIATFREAYGDDHVQVARARFELGRSLSVQERWQDAAEMVALALPILRASEGDTTKRTQDAAAILVKAYEKLGRGADAEEWRGIAAQ